MKKTKFEGKKIHFRKNINRKNNPNPFFTFFTFFFDKVIFKEFSMKLTLFHFKGQNSEHEKLECQKSIFNHLTLENLLLFTKG